MRAFDLGLAGYVLNSSVSEYTYDVLLDTYMGGVLPVAKTEEQRACAQAAAARTLVGPLTRALEDEGSERAYFDIDLPLVAVLAIMERTGAAIDVERLAQLGASTGEEIEGLRTQIFELAGQEFNADSPKQLGHILFEVLGLPARKKIPARVFHRRQGCSKTLPRSTSCPPLCCAIASWRRSSPPTSTRCRVCAPATGACIPASTTVTTTRAPVLIRIPNLAEHVPVRTQFGRHIRECFVPLEPGCKFLSADYSQIELRLLAHLSGDEALIQAFTSGADFHASTASRVFDVPIEQVTPEQRSRAKAVNFGIVYGQQAFGLAQSLGISIAEAKGMIDRYFEVHPGVRAYLDETVEQARANGYAQTMFGRKRHIPELRAANGNTRGFGERTAMNHPMQGTAADIIKIAMARVSRRLEEEGFAAHMILQVHDELDFECPIDEVERLTAMVQDVMEHVVDLRVPLIAEASTGITWADAK